jgi:enoyl-CoA hydratase
MTWTLESADRVAVLRFVHPPLNLITYADVEELGARLDEVEAAGNRVVVLTGGIDDIFITHADLDDLLALRDGRPTTGDGSAWGRVLRRLDRGPTLTIAAVNGRAWGGGCELALTCNLRWMAAGASMGFPEVALGILPGVGAHRAIRLLPEHLALELLAGGRPISAHRAAALGLVNGVSEPTALLDEVLSFARVVADHPQAAVAAVRELVVEHRDAPVRDLQRRQLSLFLDLLATEDAGHRLRAAADRYAAGADAPAALDLPGADGAEPW